MLLSNSALCFNTIASGRNQEFSRQKNRITRGFAQEFLWSGIRIHICYIFGKRLKRRGKSSSPHSKTNFLLGVCGFFVSDIINGRLVGHRGPLYLALGANH